MTRLAGYLSAACMLFLLGGSLLGADTPLAGTWRLVGTLPSRQGGNDTILVLLDISGEDKAPTLKVITHGLPPFKGAAISKVAVKDGEVSFVLSNPSISLPMQFVIPAAGAKFVAGHLVLRGNYFPAHLAKTDKKDLEDVTIETPTEGIDRFKAIAAAESIDEKNKLAEQILKDLPGRAITNRAAMMAMEAAVRSGKPEKAIGTADLVARASKLYGREYSMRLRAEVAAELAKEAASAPKAVEIIEAVVKEMGTEPDTKLVATILAIQKAALEKAGKKEEADKLSAKIDAMEAKVDEEFEKTNLPFAPKEYTGRESALNRVAIVELFTGAQCPPCVAADTAFDGLLKTYKAKDVILLQYHLHIPGPDALTNPQSEARQDYYGEAIGGTPTVLINGKVTDKALGGGKPRSGESYNLVTKEINEALSSKDATTPIQLNIEAGASGSKVGAEVRWSGIKKKDDLKLKAVLVEDVVRYSGGNGQRLHHHIVRDFPGGVKGVPIAEAAGSHSFTVDLAKLRDSLKEYLDKFEKENGPFPVTVKPLDLKKLKIVVLVQNEKTREILQAAQADLEVK